MAVSSAEPFSSLEPMFTVTSLVSGIFSNKASIFFTTPSVISKRVPGESSALMINWRWSTLGINCLSWRDSASRLNPKRREIIRTIRPFLFSRKDNIFLNRSVYLLVTSITFSIIFSSRFALPAIIYKTGTKDTATTIEVISEKLIVKDNCLNIWPTTPITKAKGRNTAILVRVEPIIAGIISLVPFIADSSTSFPNCCR